MPRLGAGSARQAGRWAAAEGNRRGDSGDSIAPIGVIGGTLRAGLRLPRPQVIS